MSKIKPLVREVRGSAFWDAIKLVFYMAGGALMYIGALTGLMRYISSIPLDIWMIVGVFLLSFFFIGVATVIGRRCDSVLLMLLPSIYLVCCSLGAG